MTQADKDTFINQNVFLATITPITGGGIALIINYLMGKGFTYNLIPLYMTLICWLLSILSGITFIVKRGNVSGKASKTNEMTEIHEDFFKAPKYIERQRNFLVIGSVFLVLWLIWHILCNTIPSFCI